MTITEAPPEAAMAKPTKTYTTHCTWCGDEMTTRLPPSRRRDVLLACGKDACLARHNEMATKRAAEMSARRSAAAKAAHARRDQPAQAWGDWGQLAAFSRKGK
jgi:hypothetical protein